LALVLARNGNPTLLWGRNREHMATIAAQRCNARYFPDTSFPETLRACPDFAEAAQADELLIAVPSQGFRDICAELSKQRSQRPLQRLCWATKGLEPGSGKLLHQVVREALGEQCIPAVISGPTFAREVADGLPTAITLASHDDTTANQLAAYFHNSCFRVYTATDPIGVEVGGATKNILAIAAGIADGLGYGANTRAALVTRGLNEMMRLGVALGGQRETFMGLAGLGDLVLTCTDDQSRNRRFGGLLAKGQTPQSAIASIGQAVEGVKAAREIYNVAHDKKISLPIIEQVYHVIYEKRPPREAVNMLLGREQKAEVSEP